MYVVLHRMPRYFGRGLKERTDIDVEPEIGKRRRDHLGAAVVPVLAHLRDEDARAAPFGLGELIRHPTGGDEVLVHLAFRRVNARNGTDCSLVPAPNLLERTRYLAQRSTPSCGFYRQV